MKSEINWIDINDKKPNKAQNVLIANRFGIITTAYYQGSGNKFKTTYGLIVIFHVTHWSEIPKNPNHL